MEQGLAASSAGAKPYQDLKEGAKSEALRLGNIGSSALGGTGSGGMGSPNLGSMGPLVTTTPVKVKRSK